MLKEILFTVLFPVSSLANYVKVSDIVVNYLVIIELISIGVIPILISLKKETNILNKKIRSLLYLYSFFRILMIIYLFFHVIFFGYRTN